MGSEAFTDSKWRLFKCIFSVIDFSIFVNLQVWKSTPWPKGTLAGALIHSAAFLVILSLIGKRYQIIGFPQTCRI